MSDQAVVKTPESNLVPVTTYDGFVQTAIEKGNIDTVERMVALKERWEAGEAKKAFHQSMAKFQKERPPLKRTKEVKHNNVLIYKYCPMDEMEETIKETLFDCGLSYRFSNVVNEEKQAGTRCTVTHILGHSEYTELFADSDQSGNKNSIQGIGSRNSYLERYSLKAILSLSSADEDDDGQGSGDTPYVRLVIHNTALRDNLDVVSAIKVALNEDDYQSSVEYIYEMGQEIFEALWVAPTKGGIFTSKQIAILKSDDYGAIRKQFYADKNTSV